MKSQWRGDEETRSTSPFSESAAGKRKLRRLRRDSATTTIGLSQAQSWMENDRAIIFGMKLTDRPNPKYDLYRYVFETRESQTFDTGGA